MPGFARPIHFCFDLLYLIAAPFILLALAIASRLSTGKRYFAGLKSRLAAPAPRQGNRKCLWVHAVSVGEVRTALPLLKEFSRAHADWEVVLTTSTAAGHEAAEKNVRNMLPRLLLARFPVDFSRLVRKSLAALRPAAVLLIELELWPNFLVASRQLGIPVLVVNGRLTERSSRRYRRTGKFGRWLFSLPTAYAVQNEEYARRFASLGVPPEKLRVLGNLKYDALTPVAAAPSETLRLLRWERRDGAPILMGGCTHPGEEAALLRLADSLLGRFPDLKLILAPRHIERAGEIALLPSPAGLGRPLKWSEVLKNGGGAEGRRILIIDVIGELDRFYQLAEVIFVGGSLISYGGHNLLEPARFGKAVLFGPSMFNFQDLAGHFLSRQAAVQVANEQDLMAHFKQLLEDRRCREDLERRSAQAAQELRGAVRRHLCWLREKLSI